MAAIKTEEAESLCLSVYRRENLEMKDVVNTKKNAASRRMSSKKDPAFNQNEVFESSLNRV